MPGSGSSAERPDRFDTTRKPVTPHCDPLSASISWVRRGMPHAPRPVMKRTAGERADRDENVVCKRCGRRAHVSAGEKVQQCTCGSADLLEADEEEERAEWAPVSRPGL